MQDLSSTVSFSPSFSFYASGNGDLVQTAVRVVRESDTYYSVKVDGDGDDFEFETSPLHEESFFHFPITTTTKTTTFQSKNDDDVAVYGGSWSIDQSVSSSPSESHSSLESSEDLEDVSGSRFYCFWSPMRSPARSGVSSKRSSGIKSSSEPKRCRIKEFLRRSHSDGAVSTTSEAKRCRFKEFLRRSHSDGGGDSSPVASSGNGSPVVKGKNKTVSYKPEVDKRRKSYLPYRQDLIGVFVGTSRFRH